jgi:hypothetical protein
MHSRWYVAPRGWALAVLAGLALAVSLQSAAPFAAQAEPGTVQGEPIKEAVWKSASKKPITPAEIDALIGQELKKAGIEPAPRTTDEQFVRRVHLDLAGRPPAVEEVKTFVADSDPHKRAKLIDKLLDGDAFARTQARYWQDVMSAHLVSNFQSRLLARPFERWMAEQLRKNQSWARITRDILTASGEAKFDDTEGKAGKAFFLGSHMGADAVVEQAAETSRVFLGVQINCAQCHDHPFDVWKREQFHELAAYFARVRPRLMIDRESKQIRFTGVNLASTDRGGMGFGGGRRGGSMGEHRMPDADNPRSGKVIHPRLLNEKAPARGLKDADRRKALVDAMVSQDNYWFSAAFVNRTWGVLLGQSFYLPVDDLGPQREAVHGPALARLAGAFAGSDHDIKKLFRVILNTETYQRQSRVGKSRGEHLYFAASFPTRLRPGALYESVVNAVGPVGGGFGGGGRGMGGPGGRFGGGGLEGMIRTEFGFDPSLKNDDIESSIPQSLILMNNAQLNQKIRAQGGNVLAKILADNKDDGAALEAVYLRALCRKPTEAESRKNRTYIGKVGSRSEAFEDILWALINSTEFQTRR